LAVEKKFVQDGFKKAMIDEFFLEKLERAGYGGMDINRTPMGTQITIRAEKPGMIIGKSGKMIRKFTKDLDVRFKMDNPQIDVQEVKRPELNAQMMATRLANALERGWYFRKAGQSTLQRIMDSGAMGVEIVVAGKLTGPRKRTEKFIAGHIKHCGKPVEEFVDVGYARAKKKLGIIGVKVRIMPPGAVLPDHIEVLAPKKEEAKPEVKHAAAPATEAKPVEGAAAEVEKIIADSAQAVKTEKPEDRPRRPPRQRRKPTSAPPRPAESKPVEAAPKEQPPAAEQPTEVKREE
jgi:small subunit ribosomal protein S3